MSTAPDPVPAAPRLRSPLWAWLAAVLGGLLLTAMGVGYHAWFRAKPPSWVVLHESEALAGTALLALALLLGPWARWRGQQPGSLRRPLALVGAALIGVHVVVSVGWWERYGIVGLGWMLKHPWSAVVGWLAALLLAALAWSSFRRGARRIARHWRRLHRLAPLMLALSVLHLVLMGKPAGWLAWWQQREQAGPPGTFWIAVFAVLVLAVRCLPARRRQAPLVG